MPDFDNDLENEKKGEPVTPDMSDESAPDKKESESFVQTSLKDLVTSAQHALGGLPDDGPETSRATEAAADTIAWNAEAATIDFVEDAVSERSSRLQELARMVAKTVSERKSELTESADDNSADGQFGAQDEPEVMEPEQMGFQALEDELDAADNDADPEPTEFVENDQLISIIESLLFSTDKPVSVSTLKALFKGTNVRTKDVERALDILASEYASSTRGVTLEEINGGFQLRTKVDNADFLKRLQKVRPFRLSGPALEAMAIIAYKQPVTKYEIDEIRGVESGHLIRALMERGMVSFQGKAEDKPGKPMAYGSTRKFLETFGLRNLRELPTLSEIDELLPEGIGEVDETEKETLADITDELSTKFSGGYSEGEEELSKINETLQSIDTSSAFFEQEKIRERERRDRDRAQDIRERIVLGDDVDPKDQRWLDRYEAKLNSQNQVTATGAPGTIAAGDIEEAAPIGDQLEALTNEMSTSNSSEGLSEGSSDGSSDDDASVGDLESNLDWDDEAEADDSSTDSTTDSSTDRADQDEDVDTSNDV